MEKDCRIKRSIRNARLVPKIQLGFFVRRDSPFDVLPPKPTIAGMSSHAQKPNLQTLAQARKLGLHPIRFLVRAKQPFNPPPGFSPTGERNFWGFAATIPRPDESLTLDDGIECKVLEVRHAVSNAKLGAVGVMTSPVVVAVATGSKSDPPEDPLAFAVKAVEG